MQKFTRALTREIEAGGERLAVTLSEEGLSFRVVGSRKPPHEMTWTACLCACTQGRAEPPGEEEIAAALKAMRAGGKERPTAPQTEPSAPTEHPAPPTAHAEHHAEPAPLSAPAHHPAPPPAPPSLDQPGAERTTREPAAGSAPDHAATAAPDRLTGLLARIDRWLEVHRPRFAKALLPGATTDQLAALEHDLGQPLSPEMQAWFRWHNGQNADVPGALVESWHLLSTRRIAQLRHDAPTQATLGDPALIPFLTDDADNFVCLDPRQTVATVRECWRGQAQHAVVASSLTEWVERFVTELETGAFVEDPERGDFLHKS